MREEAKPDAISEEELKSWKDWAIRGHGTMTKLIVRLVTEIERLRTKQNQAEKDLRMIQGAVVKLRSDYDSLTAERDRIRVEIEQLRNENTLLKIVSDAYNECACELRETALENNRLAALVECAEWFHVAPNVDIRQPDTGGPWAIESSDIPYGFLDAKGEWQEYERGISPAVFPTREAAFEAWKSTRAKEEIR